MPQRLTDANLDSIEVRTKALATQHRDLVSTIAILIADLREARKEIERLRP